MRCGSCKRRLTAACKQPAPRLVSRVDPHHPIGRLKRMTLGKFFVAGLVALFGGTIKPAHAQFPYPIPPPPPPIFNPSTPNTMPPMRQTPVAPGLPSRLPNSSFCSTFDLGPCFPQFLPPIGQDLRLTIVSTDDNGQRNGLGAADQGADNPDGPADKKTLNPISEMYAALRACWTPPPKDEGRHGMEYTIRFAFKRDGGIVAPPRRTYSSRGAPEKVRDTYRDAVDAALERCTPLHFSTGMGGAVAGRPIAIRFVDERACQFDRGNKIGPVKRVAVNKVLRGLHTRCRRSCQEWSGRSEYLAWRVLATNSSPRRSFAARPAEKVPGGTTRNAG